MNKDQQQKKEPLQKMSENESINAINISKPTKHSKNNIFKSK